MVVKIIFNYAGVGNSTVSISIILDGIVDDVLAGEVVSATFLHSTYPLYSTHVYSDIRVVMISIANANGNPTMVFSYVNVIGNQTDSIIRIIDMVTTPYSNIILSLALPHFL